MAVARSAAGRVPRRRAEAAGTGTEPNHRSRPRRRRRRPAPRWPGTGGGRGRLAPPARAGHVARSSNHRVVTTPAAAPSTPASAADVTRPADRRSHRRRRRVRTRRSATTTASRERRPRRPTTAPIVRATTTIPISRAVLSRSPNVRMAKPFSGPASHTTSRDATAPISDGRVRSTSAVVSSTVASAQPAPTTPAPAAARRRARHAGRLDRPAWRHPSISARPVRPWRRPAAACLRRLARR